MPRLWSRQYIVVAYGRGVAQLLAWRGRQSVLQCHAPQSPSVCLSPCPTLPMFPCVPWLLSSNIKPCSSSVGRSRDVGVITQPTVAVVVLCILSCL